MAPGASVLTTTAYVPNPISVPVGTTVMWINGDNVPHTSTSQNNVWDSPSMDPGSSYSRTFLVDRILPLLLYLPPGDGRDDRRPIGRKSNEESGYAKTTSAGFGVCLAFGMVLMMSNGIQAQQVVVSGSGTGANEATAVNGPVNNGTVAWAQCTIDRTAQTITCSSRVYNIVDLIAAHIHIGGPGTSGPVIIPIPNLPRSTFPDHSVKAGSGPRRISWRIRQPASPPSTTLLQAVRRGTVI